MAGGRGGGGGSLEAGKAPREDGVEGAPPAPSQLPWWRRLADSASEGITIQASLIATKDGI